MASLSEPVNKGSELRIVLLGYKSSGKSSSGNTILDREEFGLGRKAVCVTGKGEVTGRRVTVVDTPGCWGSSTVQKTAKLVQQEIVWSVALCRPGPHAVLLVIPVGKLFTDDHSESMEEHIGLLSERVWDHTMVLFTYGDHLWDTSVEQYIEREGDALQRLVEKCGNRYHVFNNKDRGDVAQVTELVEKIEEMVAGNGGDCYEIEREMVDQMEEKRRREKERGEERRVKAQKQREMMRSAIGLRIVLLGNKGAGKSSSGNTILGVAKFKLRRTVECVTREGEVAGRQLRVVDTPGWWRTYTVEETSGLIRYEIVSSVCPPGPHAVLLVIRVGTVFPDQIRESAEENLGLLSERVWDHTMVLFTHGDLLGDTSVERYIESEGEALQRLVEKCGNRYHVFNNKDRGDVAQVTELLEKIEEMVAGNGGGHFEIGTPSKSFMPLRESKSMRYNPPQMSEEEGGSVHAMVSWTMPGPKGCSQLAFPWYRSSTLSSGFGSLRSNESEGSLKWRGRSRQRISSFFKEHSMPEKVEGSDSDLDSDREVYDNIRSTSELPLKPE